MRRPIPMWIYLSGWSVLSIALLASQASVENWRHTAIDALQAAQQWQQLYEGSCPPTTPGTAVTLRSAAFLMPILPPAPLSPRLARLFDALVWGCLTACGICTAFIVVRTAALGWHAWRDRRRWPKRAEKPGDM